MEEVGRGLRTFAKPHQFVRAGAGEGAEHVLLRSTTRPVSLDTTTISKLASLSGLLSLSLHAPPCPPLARTRPQGTRTSCTRRRSRVFWPVGLLLGCCSCRKWVGARGLVQRKGRLPHDEFGSRWRVSMDTVRPTNHPSIDSCPPSTHLSLGIARVQREPVPQPSNPSCSRPAEKKS